MDITWYKWVILCVNHKKTRYTNTYDIYIILHVTQYKIYDKCSHHQVDSPSHVKNCPQWWKFITDPPPPQPLGPGVMSSGFKMILRCWRWFRRWFGRWFRRLCQDDFENEDCWRETKMISADLWSTPYLLLAIWIVRFIIYITPSINGENQPTSTHHPFESSRWAGLELNVRKRCAGKVNLPAPWSRYQQLMLNTNFLSDIVQHLKNLKPSRCW